MAERVGFEPTDRRRSTVFKTAAFDHSATSPHGFSRRARIPEAGGPWPVKSHEKPMFIKLLFSDGMYILVNRSGIELSYPAHHIPDKEIEKT